MSEYEKGKLIGEIIIDILQLSGLSRAEMINVLKTLIATMPKDLP
jgi:hypothetical protein